MCRLRAIGWISTAGGNASEGKAALAGRIVAEEIMIDSRSAGLTPGLSTFQFQGRRNGTDSLGPSSPQHRSVQPWSSPHAYACKPGSRYVTPRKVKITTPKPRMAKYAALRPRQPRVIRICK